MKGSADQSRICTFLLDMGNSEVTGPLAAFNHTSIKKESVLKLIETINSNLPKPLTPELLKKAFEQNWAELEATIKENMAKVSVKTKVRTTEDMLREVVDIVRSVDRKVNIIESQTNRPIPYYSTARMTNPNSPGIYGNLNPYVGSEPQFISPSGSVFTGMRQPTISELFTTPIQTIPSPGEVSGTGGEKTKKDK